MNKISMLFATKEAFYKVIKYLADNQFDFTWSRFCGMYRVDVNE